MAPKFDETDVFTIPHSRMKQLVRSCSEKVTVTDYTNNDALMELLSTLYGVFKEFKNHEEIENECIMRKLKTKLKEREIHNSAVCNCHSDDQFSPLIELVNSGFIYLNKQKTASDKISYGMKLRRALKNFVKDFVPHMKEEEEVFQPLLQEHFTQEELVEMKHLVIKLHLQQRRHNESKIDSNSVEDYKKVAINSLPNEIILKIFSYLNQRDLLKIAAVSRKWNLLGYDVTHWTRLAFNEWISSAERKNEATGKKDIEHIDDSDEEFEDENEVSGVEIKLLHYWIKQLLPRVGGYIAHLDLSNCKSMNNNLARRIFQLCPNLKQLDVSYTNIGDNAFKGVKFDKLEHVNFEGCSKITDNTFKFIFIGSESSLKNAKSYVNIYLYAKLRKQAMSGKFARNCEDCVKYNRNDDENIEEFSKKINFNENLRQEHQRIQEKLLHLNLSGCCWITDLSLSYLSSKFNLQNLKYLNLSGCSNLTSDGLHGFVSFCESLEAENAYYCDNILNGPFDGMANACENVECSKRFCCRNSQS